MEKKEMKSSKETINQDNELDFKTPEQLQQLINEILSSIQKNEKELEDCEDEEKRN
jgi:hypothetical protein